MPKFGDRDRPVIHSRRFRRGVPRAVLRLANLHNTQGRTTGRMPKTRVHVGRMSLVLLVTLIMPLIIGGLVDVTLPSQEICCC